MKFSRDPSWDWRWAIAWHFSSRRTGIREGLCSVGVWSGCGKAEEDPLAFQEDDDRLSPFFRCWIGVWRCTEFGRHERILDKDS